MRLEQLERYIEKKEYLYLVKEYFRGEEIPDESLNRDESLSALYIVYFGKNFATEKEVMQYGSILYKTEELSRNTYSKTIHYGANAPHRLSQEELEELEENIKSYIKKGRKARYTRTFVEDKKNSYTLNLTRINLLPHVYLMAKKKRMEDEVVLEKPFLNTFVRGDSLSPSTEINFTDKEYQHLLLLLKEQDALAENITFRKQDAIVSLERLE